jgi:hypothetical protein
MTALQLHRKLTASPADGSTPIATQSAGEMRSVKADNPIVELTWIRLGRRFANGVPGCQPLLAR